MHVLVRIASAAIASTLPLAAQSACIPSALEYSAKTVVTLRHAMHEQAVPEQDPNVPAAIAAQLAQLKDALAAASKAAFACAPPSASPEVLQATLAKALHASLTPPAEATITTRNKQDIGAYGSDLSVQVLPLTETPRFVEVDFRYGVECGDDNLLLVYEAPGRADQPAWIQRLRWDAPAYHTVADAYGDFIMLTPMTGDYRHPLWRFIVAHGHPGCAVPSRPSHFDLDLLSPSGDPVKPTITWHFEHAYTQSPTAAPRLATTDDTIDFRIGSPAAAPASNRTQRGSSQGEDEEVFRFRLTRDGLVEPLPAEPSAAQQTRPQTAPPTANSPQ